MLLALAVAASTAAPSYVRPAPVPAASGALLPWNRIVTYYGNPLSKRMGILGEIPPNEMMARLDIEAQHWRRADPKTPVKPALELVAVVAQNNPGKDGMYRARMSDALIKKVADWAESRGWLLILDVQVGRGTSAEEVRALEPWLSRPNVHLALDPEFDMREGEVPGRRIGTSGADDVNDSIRWLSELVRKRGLPPKLLLVHRFVLPMLTDAQKIVLDPRVQVVVVMDGFGKPADKAKVYNLCVTREPVQYAGLKLFYKNDKPFMTHREVLSLSPAPLVIIYQ